MQFQTASLDGAHIPTQGDVASLLDILNSKLKGSRSKIMNISAIHNKKNINHSWETIHITYTIFIKEEGPNAATRLDDSAI